MAAATASSSDWLVEDLDFGDGVGFSTSGLGSDLGAAGFGAGAADPPFGHIQNLEL